MATNRGAVIPEAGRAGFRAGGPWLIFTLSLVLAVIQINVFRWGVILPDTVEQYGQALSGHYADWHPPVMAWLWRQLTFVHPGSAPMLVLICLLYWSGIGLFAERLRRQAGLPWALAVLAWGMLPIWFGEIGSILKDSVLGALCLFVSGIIAFGDSGQRRLPPVFWLTCLVFVFVAAAMRFNAFFALGPFLALLAPLRWRDTRIKWWALTIIGCGVLLAGNVMINNILLRPAREHPELSLITFDLAGMSHESRVDLFSPAVTGTELALLDRCYTASIYNPHDTPECSIVEDDLWRYLSARHESAAGLWLNAIFRHPGAYARHRLRHFNANQRWFDRNVPEDAVYIMSAPNSFGLHFEPGRAAKSVEQAATAMAASPLGRPATWLAIALGLASIANAFPSYAAIRILAASAFFYGSGYLIVSVAPDLRYNLWTMMAASLASIIALAEWKQTQDLSRARLTLASVPFIIVLGGELLAMAR